MVVAEAIHYITDNNADIISMSLRIYEEEIISKTSYQQVQDALE